MRAVSPVVGIVALLAVTVCLVAVLTAGIATWSIDSPVPTAAFELQADSDEGTIALEHEAGEDIDIEQLSLTVAIEGTELANQPPVPFVGADGFRGTPDGPFNARSDPVWQVGEQAGLTVAGTNAPALDSGDTVTVTLAFDGKLLAELETTAT
nr:type IV pilin N-terminal domain-containing protein [Natrialba asiatica]